ncbi:MAG: hypothetical protein NVSMB27_12520 [Ktedonobacteraceae bacterium]
MQQAPLPESEAQRLAALASLHILDTPSEERFDRITRIAMHIFDVPIALVSLVDANRQWFKSCQGLYVSETSRDISFCAHAILRDDVLVIPNALLDPRFADNSLVTGDTHIRFYAGCPLATPEGSKVGTLCLLDRRPRQMSAADLRALRDLAAWAENELNTIQLRQALVTQREQAVTLRAQAQLLDLAHDTIMVRDLHTNKIIFWNQGAEQMYGWMKAEVLGNDSHTFLQTRFPQPLKEIEAELLRAGHWEGELVHSRRNGKPIVVASRWALQHGERGEPLAILEINNDITARKHAEAGREQQYREAQRARSETGAVLDAVSEAIILVSSDRRLLSVNQRFAGFFGIHADKVLGRRFDELQPEVERIFANPSEFRSLVADTAGDVERQFTAIILQCWPQSRELELFSTPVRSANGEHLGRLYVFRDVTHEREVDRMKSEFVSLVSHELRTPLTSIKGYVDLLLDGDAGELNAEQQEYLDVVKNNADRLVALINDLLDVSRIESGKIQLQRTALDIAHLIQGTADSLRPQLETKKQHLTLTIPEALPAVSGDADRVTQILTNLLSNAHKYTPPGGTIAITAHAEGSVVRVDMRDTGIGLSPEEQAQLFTKFFRARNQTTQAVGGTGLGLSITRSLVQMHGGEITVLSAPGQGSTFSFTLPTVQKTAALDAPALITRPGGSILVVDDEPDIAHLIQRYLERAGYQVHLAHNASDALKMAQTQHPDLITLDIMLPDTDGFTVLEWLKSDQATATIPVVLLSIVDDGGRGKLLGAVDYLRKPISEEALLERVGLILSEDRAQLILVADDDADIRGLVAENLRRAGYQVVEASDGAEAVALAQRDRPSLALLDIRMPAMDGIAALRALRADPATRSLPVIMMTASPGAFEESRSTIKALGGAMLLSKSHTIEELAAAIDRGLTNGGPR